MADDQQDKSQKTIGDRFGAEVYVTKAELGGEEYLFVQDSSGTSATRIPLKDQKAAGAQVKALSRQYPELEGAYSGLTGGQEQPQQEQQPQQSTAAAQAHAEATGVNLSDVEGTGAGGNITKADVVAAQQPQPPEQPA